jgi:hypothetical protein
VRRHTRTELTSQSAQVADLRNPSAGFMSHIDELGEGETRRARLAAIAYEEMTTVVKVHQLRNHNLQANESLGVHLGPHRIRWEDPISTVERGLFPRSAYGTAERADTL